MTRLRSPAAALAGYLLLSLVFTWPLVLHLGTHCPGANELNGRLLYSETPTNLWNLWWFRAALIDHHQSPFHTALLFHPIGANLWFHTLAPLHGAVGLVLQAVFSLTATFNILVLGNFVAGGLLARLFARRLGIGAGGAFLAGTVFAFSPAVLSHLYVGHLELLATAWMPAAVVVFLGLLDEPRPMRGAALGLVLAAAAYTSPYYAVYAVELLAITAVVSWRRLKVLATWRSIGVAVVTALLALLPFIRQWVHEPAVSAASVNSADFVRYAGDLTGFVRPSFMNPLLASVTDAIAGPAHSVPQETTIFVGFTLLGLAALAVVHRRSAPRAVLLGGLIALVFAVLSLGSHLEICGHPTGVPLPTLLAAQVPVLRQLRAPGRHVIPALLGLGILAGAGWERIRLRSLRVAALLLLGVEYLSGPIPLFATGLPAVYRRLALAEGGFAVLELPFGVRDGNNVMGRPDARQLLGQTLHHHPILTGMVSRMPQSDWRALAEPPVLHTLLQPGGPIADWRLNKDRDRWEGPSWFRRNRVEAIVVHPEVRDGPEERYVESVLPAKRRELFSDGTVLLWLNGPE